MDAARKGGQLLGLGDEQLQTQTLSIPVGESVAHRLRGGVEWVGRDPFDRDLQRGFWLLGFDVNQRLIARALCVVVVAVNEGGDREKEGRGVPDLSIMG